MRKIGITGHTSGIGKEIYDHCMFKGYEVYGYSRATGFNMVVNDADDIINDILRRDLDYVFNNAWLPRLQNKILKVLHWQWRDREGTYIVTTGSGSIYQPGLTGDAYTKDKTELRDYCIEAANTWPLDNKCRIFNVSMGWVNTAMVVEENENFLDAYSAALIMLNLIEEQKYVVPELVIGTPQIPREEIEKVVNKANEYIVNSIVQSNIDAGKRR
jgi:NAD(P)-dependent dehydrogenase (short-subunit alcohol dehydrogenase family)